MREWRPFINVDNSKKRISSWEKRMWIVAGGAVGSRVSPPSVWAGGRKVCSCIKGKPFRKEGETRDGEGGDERRAQEPL